MWLPTDRQWANYREATARSEEAKGEGEGMRTITVHCDQCGTRWVTGEVWISIGERDYCSKKCQKRHEKKEKR